MNGLSNRALSSGVGVAGQEGSRSDAPRPAHAIRFGTGLKIAVVLTILAALGIGLLDVLAAAGQDPGRPGLADFNTFHIVGRMIGSGRFADAYRIPVLLQIENAGADPDHRVFMPWSYPPAFGLIVAPLGALPLGAAYLLFLSASLALFCLPMRALGGPLFWPVFLAAAPSILINIRTGQNGLAIGGAEALSALLLLRRRPFGAGFALAGLALKPHLGLTLPVALVLQRRWLTLASAAAAGLAVTGLSLAVFGSKVFSAFLDSLGDVGPYMAAGAYPLHRMTSHYAALLAAGVPNTPALVLHGCAAAMLLGLTLRVAARSQDARLGLGLAMMAGLFISPYLYDYDLPVFDVGLMLAAPTLVRRLTARQYAGLLIAVALSELPGMAVDALGIRASLGGPMMLGCFCAVLWTAASARQPTRMARHAGCDV